MAAFALFQAWSTWSWTRQPLPPPHWDHAVHLDTAFDYRAAWQEGRWPQLLVAKPRPGHPAYPPAYHYSLTPAAASAVPLAAVGWVNLAYLLLLVFSAASIAWKLSGPWAGLAATLLLGLSPIAVVFRDAFPDVALASWVAAAYAAFARSRNYEDRRMSLVVGVCAGLAALSKWSALIYLFPCWAAGLHDRSARKNLALATGLAAAMSGPWYLLNAFNVFSRVAASAGLGASEGDPTGFTAAAWSYYFKMLSLHFTWAGAAAMIAAGAWALSQLPRRQWLTRSEPALAAWLAFSYAFWSGVSNKDFRYILPAAAAAPVLAAAAFPLPALGLSAALALRGAGAAEPAEARPWPIDEILAEAQKKAPAAVCVLANHESLNTTSLRWLARHAGYRSLSFGCTESKIPEWADLVLVKTDKPGHYLGDRTRGLIADAARPDSLFSSVFRERRRWDLPDGSQAVLFEQRAGLASPRGPIRRPELEIRSARLEGVELKRAGGRTGDYVLSVSTLTMGKFQAPIRGIRLGLHGARLLADGRELYVLGIATVSILSAELGLADASQALSRRSGLPWTVSEDAGGLSVSTRLGFVPARLRLGVRLLPGGLEIGVRGLSLAGVPIPGAGLLRRAFALEARPPAQPYALVLSPIHLKEGRLQIAPE